MRWIFQNEINEASNFLKRAFPWKCNSALSINIIKKYQEYCILTANCIDLQISINPLSQETQSSLPSTYLLQWESNDRDGMTSFFSMMLFPSFSSIHVFCLKIYSTSLIKHFSPWCAPNNRKKKYQIVIFCRVFLNSYRNA